jgi:hypothetical protein
MTLTMIWLKAHGSSSPIVWITSNIGETSVQGDIDSVIPHMQFGRIAVTGNRDNVADPELRMIFHPFLEGP